MTSRRAVRVFTDTAVPIRLLRALVGAARSYGPGEESGPVSFIMVEGRPAMARVMQLAVDWLRREGILTDQAVGADPDSDAGQTVFGGAPHLAVCYGPSGDQEAAAACILAMARLEWAATALGLGACFAGEVVRAAAGCSAVAAAMSLPAGNTAFAAVFLGYPGFPAHQPETVRGNKIIWL